MNPQYKKKKTSKSSKKNASSTNRTHTDGEYLDEPTETSKDEMSKTFESKRTDNQDVLAEPVNF